MRCFDCTVRPALAAKSGFLPTISHNMKFPKDIALKSDGRISKKHFLFDEQMSKLKWKRIMNLAVHNHIEAMWRAAVAEKHHLHVNM